MAELTRRSALRGAAVAAVGAAVGAVVARNSKAAHANGPANRANAYGGEPATSGAPLIAVAAVPLGGGVVRGRVVLTRPAGNDVRAFSAVCTHQGCLVDRVANGKIYCPCHGSVFDARTGGVVTGPATQSLPKVDVVVRAGQVLHP